MTNEWKIDAAVSTLPWDSSVNVETMLSRYKPTLSSISKRKLPYVNTHKEKSENKVGWLEIPRSPRVIFDFMIVDIKVKIVKQWRHSILRSRSRRVAPAVWSVAPLSSVAKPPYSSLRRWPSHLYKLKKKPQSIPAFHFQIKLITLQIPKCYILRRYF